MRSPASNHSEAHGRAWARPICGSMGCRAPASNHHQVPPARNSSRAPTGRRIAVGRFYSDISQVREVMAREHTGLLPEVIRAVVEFFPERQVAAADPLHHVLQDTADAAKVVHVSHSSIRLLDSHDANENGLPYAQTSFAPGAKAHD